MTLSIGLVTIGSFIIAFMRGYSTIGVLAPILLIIARLRSARTPPVSVLSRYEIRMATPPRGCRCWVARSRDEGAPRLAHVVAVFNGVPAQKSPIQPILTGRHSSRQFDSKDLGGLRPRVSARQRVRRAAFIDCPAGE
jgi:hypothetical protein